jgi:hypothetical protein
MSKRRCLEDHELLRVLGGETVEKPVTEHLNACATCRERLERLRLELRTLRQPKNKRARKP